jgi:aminomuconate-semialdehyde/2-hydroxymuconate-6-semialdehyde dehydrogenase
MALRVFRHVIDGEEVESVDGRRFSSVNPWTRSPWAEAALGSERDVARAVQAARRAFDDGGWPRMGMKARGRILHRLADLVEANSETLAEADSTDMGKPIEDMRGTDVPRTAEYLRFFADQARLAAAEKFPMDSRHHAYTRYEPAGVVGAITPWNFPLMLETWKVAPALAWGNTVVLKPAETTPASASILARLALEAGLPPGVLNVVHGFGPDSAGQALTTSALVDRITFTGESATGRAVSRAAAEHLTPVSLELGGKGANIVFDDADLDSAVSWSLKAVYTNAGQICLAGSRIYVQRRVCEEFVARFVAAADELVVGDPMAAGTHIGPLASEEHFAKVTGYLATVPAEGGTLLTGGRGDGWMVRPTVIVDAPASARVAREEVFGPVVVIFAFDSDDEAVRLANDTPFGLTAMLFTENLRRAHRVSAALRAGTVWVNCFFVSDLRAPFGGVGHSGVGREGGAFSKWFFTEPKAVVMEI